MTIKTTQLCFRQLMCDYESYRQQYYCKKDTYFIFGYQFMFQSPKQRLGRLGIIEGQASVLVFSIMG